MGMDLHNYADVMLGYRVSDAQCVAAVKAVCLSAKRLGATRDDAVSVIEALGLDAHAIALLTRPTS